MVVIMAPHLQLLPLCAWGGKLSAKQWSVISGQWSQEASAASWGPRSLGTPSPHPSEPRSLAEDPESVGTAAKRRMRCPGFVVSSSVGHPVNLDSSGLVPSAVPKNNRSLSHSL